MALLVPINLKRLVFYFVSLTIIVALFEIVSVGGVFDLATIQIPKFEPNYYLNCYWTFYHLKTYFTSNS